MAATDFDWQFGHVNPTLAPCMNEVFANLCSRYPLVHTNQHGGYWAALSYDAVRTAFREHNICSSAGGAIFPSAMMSTTPQYPLDADPPEDGTYRRIIQGYFTRASVTRYEVTLRRLVRERIRTVVGGEVDLVPARQATCRRSLSLRSWACRRRTARNSCPGTSRCSSR